MSSIEIGKEGSLNFAQIAQLKADAKRDSGESIGKVAEQFEAIFIEMMLRSMRKATERSGLLDSNASKSYEDLFDGEIASELSKKGSLGIADSIERLLAHQRGKMVSDGKDVHLLPTSSRSFALQDNVDQDGELKARRLGRAAYEAVNKLLELDK